MAALAVSFDARFLATNHEDRSSIVVRRTSDGGVVASAAGPKPEYDYVDAVPMLAAWSQAGDRLAVLWRGSLSLYEFR